MRLDYSFVLSCLTLGTGAVWLAERVLRGRRGGAAARAAGPPVVTSSATVRRKDATRHRLRAIASLFPLLFAVFAVRSFAVEPFRIPSGSMMPTLEAGDFILVDKFSYGLRLPVVDRVVVPVGSPHRGDVVVFRYPLDPAQNYVKRVVGLPGDTIVYRDKRLSIDGVPVPLRGGDATPAGLQAVESLPGATGGGHDVLLDPGRDDRARPIARFDAFDACRYASDGGVACTVPPGRYFVMGDNRDNSADSRYWGFVPDDHLVGRAVVVWMNFEHPGRIGRFR